MHQPADLLSPTYTPRLLRSLAAPTNSTLMGRLDFLKESVKNIRTTGTILRSSTRVCKKMISFIDFSKAKHIVELGAGDGVITKHILKHMRPDAKLIAFEVLERFAKQLNTIDDDRLVVAHDSAENIGDYLARFGQEQADYIVSAIPFVVVPDEIKMRIMKEAVARLKPGGRFIQLHYSLKEKKMYEDAFGDVDVNFVLLNVPPCYVLVCDK